MAPSAQPASQQTHGSGKARVAGSAIAGALELGMFHPVDTAAKRLMSNKTAILSTHEGATVIFAGQTGMIPRARSLWPGIGPAAAYKLLQRVYKYSGQLYARDAVESLAGNRFRQAFGDKYAKPMIHACAGSLVGIGEIVLLPLDVLKIKLQTNPESMKGKGSIFSIVRSEGIAPLYRGAGWTAARNAPGSFALFGGNALVHEKLFKLDNYAHATFAQNFVASIGGSTCSLLASAPLDVIKTRIQRQEFSSRVGGVTILKDLLKNEGFFALYKGIVPKMLAVGPKLVFSFTIAQTLIGAFEERWKN